MITAYHVKTICTSNHSTKYFPMRPLSPNKYNNTNPRTFGCRTSGNKIIASTILFPVNELRAMSRATIVPTIKTTIVAMVAVFKDSHKGDKYIASITHHLDYFSNP